MIVLAKREDGWIKKKKKLQNKLIKEYFMFKMLVWFAMEKSRFKIFRIKMHCEADHMSQSKSLYN